MAIQEGSLGMTSPRASKAAKKFEINLGWMFVAMAALTAIFVSYRIYQQVNGWALRSQFDFGRIRSALDASAEDSAAGIVRPMFLNVGLFDPNPRPSPE